MMTTSEVPARRRYAVSLRTRYEDGYRVAKIFATVGNVTKIAGFPLTALTIVGGMCLYSGVPSVVVAAAGIAIWLSSFVTGTLISVQGLVLKANVDIAVNTSPFLSDDQRAITMSP